MEGSGGDYVCAVSFSPDGRQIAIASGRTRMSVALLNAATGRCEAQFLGAPGQCTALAFSPDGKQLLTVAYCRSEGHDGDSAYSEAKLWDATALPELAAECEEMLTLRGLEKAQFRRPCSVPTGAESLRGVTTVR